MPPYVAALLEWVDAAPDIATPELAAKKAVMFHHALSSGYCKRQTIPPPC